MLVNGIRIERGTKVWNEEEDATTTSRGLPFLAPTDESKSHNTELGHIHRMSCGWQARKQKIASTI